MILVIGSMQMCSDRIRWRSTTGRLHRQTPYLANPVHWSRPVPFFSGLIAGNRDVSLAEYCGHRILDTFIHGWDIARATGQDDTLDPDLVDIAYAMFEPHSAELQASGAFGTPVPVPANADTQTKLLAMLGRDNRR